MITPDKANELALKRWDLSFILRPETLDPIVVQEASAPHGYYEKLDLRPNDVVLDIGANIGVFSAVAARSCREVISIEPDPDNFMSLLLNMKKNNLDNFHAIRAAVIGGKEKTIPLWLNGGRNPGNHSIIPKRGRRSILVPAVNINDLLETHSPNKIKLDAEGAEVEIIRSILDWSRVRAIVLEFHFGYIGRDFSDQYDDTIRILREHFSFVHAPQIPNALFPRIVHANNF